MHLESPPHRDLVYYIYLLENEKNAYKIYVTVKNLLL